MNVDLVGLLNLSQFRSKKAVLPSCSRFTTELEKLEFFDFLDFIFIHIMRIIFQARYVCRREKGTRFKIKLPVLKEINVHIYITILCQSAGNAVFKLE